MTSVAEIEETGPAAGAFTYQAHTAEAAFPVPALRYEKQLAPKRLAAPNRLDAPREGRTP
ncbi:MAG: hypothetical protein GEU93_13750 [Propionibacteriales bacterium]|nr:hypothetical protein [Propionibacteriales bacterium]